MQTSTRRSSAWSTISQCEKVHVQRGPASQEERIIQRFRLFQGTLKSALGRCQARQSTLKLLQEEAASYIASLFVKEREAAAVKLQAAVRGFLARLRSRVERLLMALPAAPLELALPKTLSAVPKVSATHEVETARRATAGAFSVPGASKRPAMQAVPVRAIPGRARHFEPSRLLKKASRAALDRLGERRGVKEAALTLQRAWRRLMRKRALRTALQAILRAHKKHAVESSAIALLQRQGRSFCARVHLKGISAIVRIQSILRGHQVRRQLRLRRAAVRLQSHVRGHLVRLHVAALHARCAAAVKLQAAFRGHQARCQAGVFLSVLVAARCAAVKIQALVRQRQAKAVVGALRARLAAAVKLQAATRRRQAQTRLNCFRARRHTAAVRLGSATRGMLVRRAVGRWQHAAVCVQRLGRGFLARRRLQRLHQAAVHIQRCLRGMSTRLQLGALHAITVRLQAQVRGQLARGLLRALQARYAAVAKLQAAVRGHQARCKVGAMQAARDFSAVRIQSFVRRWQDARAAKQFALRAAAVTIQRHFHGSLTRSRLRLLQCSAARLQRAFRRFAARQQIRRAVVKLQSLVRGGLVRLCFQRSLHLLDSLVRVQALMRGALVRRRMQKLLKHLKQKAVSIQRTFRRFLARRTQGGPAFGASSPRSTTCPSRSPSPCHLKLPVPKLALGKISDGLQTPHGLSARTPIRLYTPQTSRRWLCTPRSPVPTTPLSASTPRTARLAEALLFVRGLEDFPLSEEAGHEEPDTSWWAPLKLLAGCCTVRR